MNKAEAYKKLEKLTWVEERFRDLYRIRTDASLKDSERHRRLRELFVSWASNDEEMDKEDQEQWKRALFGMDDPKAQELLNGLVGEHLTQTDYGLSGGKHVMLNQHARYFPGFYHDHEYIEIAYVLKGTCTHEFVVESDVVFSKMRTGSALIIPPGQKHRVEINDDSIMFNLLVRTDTFEKLFLSYLPDQNRIYDFFARVMFSGLQGYILIHTEESDRLTDLMLDIRDELETGGTYADEICDRLLGAWFLYLLRCAREIEEPAGTHGQIRRAEVLSVLMYIEMNCENATLAQIQDRYHLSAAWLNHIFKEEMGTTIQKYILSVRMRKARELLITTEMPVAAIGERMGYEAASYFVSSFRKEYGVTPLQMRKEHRSREARNNPRIDV